MSFGSFFVGKKTPVALFISGENHARHCEKDGIKARVIDVNITWVSNYKKFKSDICNSTPT